MEKGPSLRVKYCFATLIPISAHSTNTIYLVRVGFWKFLILGQPLTIATANSCETSSTVNHIRILIYKQIQWLFVHFSALVSCVHTNVSLTHANAPLTHVNVPLTRANVALTRANVALTRANVALTHANVL